MRTQKDYPAVEKSCMVKKDWKTTLQLLPDYATDVEQSFSLYHKYSVAGYCISWNKRPGVYFLKDPWTPAFKRGRRLFETDVYLLYALRIVESSTQNS